jgi:pimeloyl-ACP methyl ester carboxylesterase
MQQGARIDVGGYCLFFQSVGSGQPTIVFESGGDDGADSLAQVARQVQSFSRALIYDRAGLGQSDPAPRPRTIQDAVADLHALLHAAQVPGPYLLVGHSYGGLIIRLYAHTYPHEVVGLVLLDVPPADLSLRELRLLPPPLPQEPAALTDARNMAAAEWKDPFNTREGFDRAASAAQLQATGQLGSLPLVVITAGIDEWPDGFPAAIARAMEQDWMDAQHELVALSTDSTHIIATESTHSIQECQPDLVIDAIRSLVEKLRA